MHLEEGQRVTIKRASGDRKRFNGRCGEVVKLQQGPREGVEPFAFVKIEGRGNTQRGHRVFFPSELQAEEEGAECN